MNNDNQSKDQLLEGIKRFKRLAQLSMMLPGDPLEVFNYIARMIAELLDVRVVGLSEIRGDQLHFLSMYANGKILKGPGHCLLADTPCAAVEENRDFRIYTDVCTLFPKAEFLQRHKAVSYCGFPALDSAGNVLAVACLIDDRPHEFSEEDKAVLRIVGQRIGMEMERLRHLAERSQLEIQLHQAQKMEAIGRLAGGIAHDFNNLLTAIIGYGNLLSTKLGEGDPLRNYAEKILAASEKAATLTKGLLAFSRRQLISLKPVDVNVIIRNVENLLSRLIGEDIELITVLEDEQLVIMADSGQIEQVLMNLATNARDAMPNGGVLTLRTGIVEVTAEDAERCRFMEPGSYVLVSMKDTGSGMDEKTRERIFEPFFTTKEVGKGTGLGLSIAYGLVKQHSGSIIVESEIGKGTLFKLYFPLARAAMKRTKPSALPLLVGGNETILVAEDGEEVRRLIREVLEEYGYSVIEAADGEEAVHTFKAHQGAVQLLILDVIMPKKNGKETYEEIRKLEPGIKALFTSGYTADIIHKKGIMEEELNFIAKPVLPDILLRKVRETLDK